VNAESPSEAVLEELELILRERQTAKTIVVVPESGEAHEVRDFLQKGDATPVSGAELSERISQRIVSMRTRG
jgi:hypothetical protein